MRVIITRNEDGKKWDADDDYDNPVGSFKSTTAMLRALKAEIANGGKITITIENHRLRELEKDTHLST